MENQEQNIVADKVLAFDTIFTNNHIKMLKVLIFFLDSPIQKMLAAYIKFLELQHTLTYMNTHTVLLKSHSGTLDINALCRELTPYCSKDEKDKINNILNMYQSMENFRQISQTMEMMKDLFPEGMSNSENMFSSFFDMNSMGNTDIFNMFTSMMGSLDNTEQ